MTIREIAKAANGASLNLTATGYLLITRDGRALNLGTDADLAHSIYARFTYTV